MNNERKMIKRERVENFTHTSQHVYEHYSGLTISFVPKPGFNRKFVSIALPVGADHLNFYAKAGKPVCVPAGTAHFMEHCVFKHGHDFNFDDVMAGYGINANAYTTNDHTLYFFSCVDHLYEGLQLFLESLLSPDLTAERVDKERRIILSELEMYQDDVAGFAAEKLLCSLYVNHPVRNDIVGTRESLAAILPEHLQKLHSSFYRPSNMKISIVGDVNEEEVIAKIFAILEPHMQDEKLPKVLTTKVCEPSAAGKTVSSSSMQIARPYFCFGIKDPDVNSKFSMQGRELVGYEIGLSLLFDLLIGESSRVYNELFAEGLIDESFYHEFKVGSDYAYWMCASYSEDPHKAATAIYQALQQAVRNRDLGGADFALKVKAETGAFLLSLDSISSSGYKMAELLLRNLDLFDELSIYNQLDVQSLWEKAEFVLNESLQSLHIVSPLPTEKSEKPEEPAEAAETVYKL